MHGRVIDYTGAAHVESRASGHFHWYYPFVFGDSFADTGNLAKSSLSEQSRQWYAPYGRSRLSGHPTGRFSDGIVQSDLVGKILGRYEAPVAYRRRGKNYVEAAGVNYAVGGSGVYAVPHKAPTLAKQIHYFREMIEGGTVGKWQLKSSVALVAVSGNDYARMSSNSTVDEIQSFAGNVTDEIARAVERLQKLGVTKVLVNALHPLGCTPLLTRQLNYTGCDSVRGNAAPYYHNKKLREKLASSDSVYVVDLYAAFSNIVDPADAHAHPQVAKKFKRKLKPCCESVDPNGYCGQLDEDGGAKYSVCSNPDEHFYWDDVHPTQAGWEAVMEQLEWDIKDFLDISD
ncbi:hypothetical protein BS78_03G050900 [Paspalum vaginatum]|nr:hypothetical protein BS78_03G050900 [Paspalum vaginatum]